MKPSILTEGAALEADDPLRRAARVCWPYGAPGLTPGEKIARDAGFRKPSEATTATDSTKAQSFAIMDVVPSNIMPEGWIGLRTEKGVHCIGPKGSFFVPAFDLQQALQRELPLHTKEER